MLLPSSPRTRRRLAWCSIPLAAIGVGALVVALVPEAKKLPTRFSDEPVQTVARPRQVPLSKADRQAIDAVLDRFVPAAVERRDPGSAWKLVTPAMRAGTTLREWARGEVPVVSYPARGRRFHDWVLQYSYRNLVGLELGLEPRPGEKVGAAAFQVELKRRRGVWLVDSIYLRAIYPR